MNMWDISMSIHFPIKRLNLDVMLQLPTFWAFNTTVPVSTTPTGV